MTTGNPSILIGGIAKNNIKLFSEGIILAFHNQARIAKKITFNDFLKISF